MTIRHQVFWTVAIPLATLITLADARVGAQQPGNQPAASGSGIDLAAMDRSADPCSDFYQFACGGWLAKHPIPPDRGRYGRFEELQDRNYEILKSILEDAAKPDNSADWRKIGDYYSSCMDEAAIESKRLEPLEPELERVAAIKTKNDLPAVVGHLQTIGVVPFFSVGARPDFKDASQVIATFDIGALGLPDRDYYIKDDAKSVQLRDQYAQHVTKMLQLAGDTPDHAAAGATAIVQIETALARRALERVARRTPANIYHRMSMDEVRKLLPSVNLSPYLETAEVPSVTSANVAEPEFMKAADEVIAASSLDDLKTYVRWHTLHANADMLPKAFDQATFAFYGTALTGAQEQRPRWKRCVNAVDSDLGEALGKAYVDRTFGTEGKERTLQMVRAIEAALGEDIEQITWMSDETKRQAEVKLRAVANKIGYPDRWRDYSSLRIVRGDALGNSVRSNTFTHRRQLAKIGKPVDKTEWLMTPPTVNAYYNPLENNINFPAGILQPPFFIKAADDAVNFGAAGAVVGHELTHGFDDQGRQFDADGNLREWWTAADGKAFEERAACVANQYGGYTAVDDVKLNGRLTLGENVADNGGLRLAWMALMDDLKAQALGEVDGFSPEQRFFVGWGQMWCENRTKEIALLHAKTNPHSPGRYRTNGVVSNFPEFQRAFSCQPTSKMVKQPICRVW
jgi:putative endopeptidase